MGDGVEVRANSIRLFFVFNGRQRRTLKTNGVPLPPTPANIKYAHRLAAEIRDKIRHGTFALVDYFPDDPDVTGGSTVAAQLDGWLAAQRIATSTRKAYESAVRFWKAAPCTDAGQALGAIELSRLRHSHVGRALATRPGLSGKTVNNYVSVLREACQLAVLDRRLPANPLQEVPRAAHQRPDPDPFSTEEVGRVLDAMRRLSEPVCDYTQARFYTGLRSGETFATLWRHVDLANARLTVSESVVRGERKGTKTSTVRTVRLNSLALEAFARQRERVPAKVETVWLDPRYGQPWADERAYRRSFWAPALEAAGVRYRTPYTTRHTYATMMLMAGLKPAFCAGQMGHSVEMFHRVYSRWIGGQSDDLEMARLEASLAASSPAVPREGD